MTSVIQEIMTLYKVDGIFANRWSGSGMCYCQHCQRNFKEFSGLELPAEAEAASGGSGAGDARAQFTAWQKKRLLDLYTLWDAEIRKRNPEAVFFPNGFDQIQRQRFGPDSVCGPAVPLRIPVALAERQVCQGCPLDLRLEADRGHIQCRIRGALPLEGLHPEPQ